MEAGLHRKLLRVVNPAFKIALSALILVAVSEISKKFPTLGGLVASLHLLSVLGMIWIYADTRNSELIASHSSSTFWFVLPSLPMFLILPWFLRKGLHFAWAMLIVCLITMALYALMVFVLKKWGVAL